MSNDWPSGLARIPLVTRFAIRTTHGLVLLALEANLSSEDFAPLQEVRGLTAEQAVEIGRELVARGQELLSQSDNLP